MNDEKFELTISDLAGSGTYYADIADELRARDTAQREALARVEAKLANKTGTTDFLKRSNNRLTAQLAEAVGLLWLIQGYLEEGQDSKVKSKIRSFISRHRLDEHAQAEQQEAQGAQAEPANFGQELEAFEKWRHAQAESLRRCGCPDGADAFIRLGSVQWAGWQARAALATQPASHAGEFQREDRYIVIKRKDLGAVPLEVRESLGVALFQLSKHLPKRECLVVESDWPEYEPTWAAIQARVTCQGGDERSHFEKWFFETNNISLDEYPHWNARDELGEYRSGVVDVAWGVWQARAALATHPAEWADPVALASAGPVYDQGFADGVAEAKRLNAVRGAEHE